MGPTSGLCGLGLSPLSDPRANAYLTPSPSALPNPNLSCLGLAGPQPNKKKKTPLSPIPISPPTSSASPRQAPPPVTSASPLPSSTRSRASHEVTSLTRQEIDPNRLERDAMKYVLVTGGVVSGLGKGVTASSIGVLLKSCGFRVTSIKIGKPAAAAAARARGASVSDFSPLGPTLSGQTEKGGE